MKKEKRPLIELYVEVKISGMFTSETTSGIKGTVES